MIETKSPRLPDHPQLSILQGTARYRPISILIRARHEIRAVTLGQIEIDGIA